MIIRLAVKKGDVATGNSRDWTSKAIVDATLQSTDVEIVKVRIERRVSLPKS